MSQPLQPRSESEHPDVHALLGSGLGRLADAVSASQLQEVMLAAFDLGGGCSARRLSGYADIVAVADRINGAAWADAVIAEPAVRMQWFEQLRNRARRVAAAQYRRLPEDIREGVIDELAVYLCRPYRAVPGTGIMVPSWESWAVWYPLLIRRLGGAASAYDNGHRTPAGDWHVAWYDLWELADNLPAGPQSPDALSLEGLIWHEARHLLGATEAELLGSCHAGSKLVYLSTVCTVALSVLEQGADHSDIRDLFIQDPKLAVWRSLVTCRPDTWGRYYSADAIPTRAVLEAVAATFDHPFTHSVAGRLKDLNDTKRLVHQTIAMVREMLRQAAERNGIIVPPRPDGQ